MRKTVIASALFAASVLPSLAAAQTAAPADDYTITGNVSLINDYRFRGITQTMKKPALQGGFDFSHASGFYLGNWNSNVSEYAGFPGGNLEMDFYGGYKTTFGDFGLDVGAIYYYYPGSKYNFTGSTVDNKEIYIGGSWQFLSAKYYYSVGDYFSDKGDKNKGTDGTGYLDLAATYDLGGGWGVNGHVGHLSYKGRDKADYTDWKLGVTKDVKGYVFGLAYVGTNARDKAGDWYSFTNASTGKVVAAGADTVLVSVSKTF